MDIAVDSPSGAVERPFGSIHPDEPKAPDSWLVRLGRTLFLRPLCYVAGIDYKTILRCPTTDRIWALQLGAQLVISFCLIFSISFYSAGYVVEDVRIRAGVAAVVASAIFMFDRALFQSDWFLQLKKKDWERWLRIGIRLVISICIAYVLSLFLELAIFSDTINQKLQDNFLKANSAQFQGMARFEQDLDDQIVDHQQRLRALENSLSDALDITGVGQVANQARELSAQREKVTDQIADYELRANAEQYGQRMLPDNTGLIGRGPAYQFAVEQLTVLKRRQEEIDARIAALRTELDTKRPAIEAQISQLRTELTKLQDSKATQVATNRAATMNSPAFRQLSTDPLARMAAYDELWHDPERGGAIMQFSILTKIFVIFLELVPVLSKMFFSPLTAYGQLVLSEIELLTSRSKTKVNEIISEENESAIDRSVRERAAVASNRWASEEAG